MAYVRTHGNQVAIVHGERDPESGKVQQRVLFTLYSRPEALAVLGRSPDGEDNRLNFEGLLELKHPAIRFDWKRIRVGIEERLEQLPEIYPYRPGEFLGRFREDLCTFTRQLELADPQTMYSAAELLQEQRYELEHLRDLIDWRLRLCDQQEGKWNTDNRFFWRHRLRSEQVPYGLMEKMGGLWERGEHERLGALARFFLECFDDYADGHHYLGLIELDREDPQRAIEHFERAVAAGRRLFPKRMAKKHFWTDTDTRPYMRALRSLTIAKMRTGALDGALALCARLERECGDDEAAAAFRCALYLLSGRWELALDRATHLVGIWPEQAFHAAFASYELGRLDEARVWLLHGLLNRPHAGHILLGLRCPKPEDSFQADDHNTGVDLSRDLAAYLDGWDRSARAFFHGIARHEQIRSLLAELREVTKRWKDERTGQDRSAYQRMTQLGSLEFAREVAGSLLTNRS